MPVPLAVELEVGPPRAGGRQLVRVVELDGALRTVIGYLDLPGALLPALRTAVELLLPLLAVRVAWAGVAVVALPVDPALHRLLRVLSRFVLRAP